MAGTPFYRFVAADLLTDAYVADLPLKDVSFERKIIEPGTLSATIEIPNRDIADLVARVIPRHPDDLSTGPGRTVVHVIRSGVIWGTYVIWAASVSQQGRGPVQVGLQGSTLESYLNRVLILNDLGPYEEADQVEIARNLLASMQSDPAADIGLALQPGTSGVLRDRTYLASENVSYGQRLAELAVVDDGFEYIVHTSLDQGTGARSRSWQWGYPRLGSIDSNHVFGQSGDVLSWQEDIDSTRGATRWQTRGETVNTDVADESVPLTSDIYPAQAHLDAGWPRLDATVDYSTVSEVDTLNAYAAMWAATRAGAVRVHQATVRLPVDTAFSPANLGDYVRLMLVNDWWPIEGSVASFSKSWRVIGMGVKPPSRDSGLEECTLVFEEAVDS